MIAAIQIEEHLSEQARIVGEVLGLMAGIVAAPAGRRWPPSEELVAAAIHFSGPWKGAMVLECSLPLAFEFTARFMATPLPATVDADVRDALAELVNMIAGNFKALMPPETRISIPSVSQGRDRPKEMQGGKILSQVVFGTEQGEFCLSLLGVTLK